MAELAYSSAEDAELVKAAQKGDTEAFEELVARHRDKIYARAFSMMRNEDEAIDLSQEAWVKGWQRLRQFQGNSIRRRISTERSFGKADNASAALGSPRSWRYDRPAPGEEAPIDS